MPRTFSWKTKKKVSKHRRSAFHARKTLHNFQFTVLRQMRGLFWSYASSSVKRKLLAFDGYNVRSSDIACCDKWESLFSNVRLLFSKTQYCSDTTSNIKYSDLLRILYQNFGQFWININGYILRKPVFRRKMRISKQSHSAEKCKNGDPLGFLKLQFVAKYKKMKRGDIKNFQKNSAEFF